MRQVVKFMLIFLVLGSSLISCTDERYEEDLELLEIATDGDEEHDDDRGNN